MLPVGALLVFATFKLNIMYGERGLATHTNAGGSIDIFGLVDMEH